MVTMDSMSKEKANNKPKKPDRHRSRKMVGVRKPFHAPAQVLVERLGLTGLGDLINLALREKLEREGLWPPKS